jgi:hypothetical protein
MTTFTYVLAALWLALGLIMWRVVARSVHSPHHTTRRDGRIRPERFCYWPKPGMATSAEIRAANRERIVERQGAPPEERTIIDFDEDLQPN